MLGLATAGTGAAGWLFGPSVGNRVFSVVYRRLGDQIGEVSFFLFFFLFFFSALPLENEGADVGFLGGLLQKEKDFYQRIKRNRVDPAGASSANPVPDYYGEKIGSVQEYRNWMKDQRAFNKKRQNFL